MRIVIIVGLSNKSIDYHVSLIAKANIVDEIYIIRDRFGPSIKKVQYYCPPEFINNIPLIKELYKLLLTFIISLNKKPDVFQSYILIPHGFIALLSSIFFNKPVIISILNGKSEVYNFGSSPKSLDYNKLPLIGVFLIILLKCFNIITTTGSITKVFFIRYGLNPDKIFILPHVIPSKKIKKVTKKHYDCIYVGRLSRIKHIEVMIKAITLVKKRLPDVKALILGDGVCMKELKNLVVRLGLSDNVSFLGYVNNVDFYLQKSKCFIFCSEREGLPFAILEAIYNGVPVISSDCGDVTDVLIDGYNSKIISDYNDYYKYHKYILRFLCDLHYYNSYVKNILNDNSIVDSSNSQFFWDEILKNITDK